MQYIEQNKQMFKKEMSRYLREPEIPIRLKESMLYSVEAGGKMLRPVLLLASFDGYNQNAPVQRALSAAIALEMIHTYSLIHDDLPAMDNDDYRRGKLTNHKVYDEATAILAGDALLTLSFELISNDTYLADSEKVKLIQLLSAASGPKGMVGGQVLDMAAEKEPVTLAALENIHTLKTGELLKFAVYSGAYLAGAAEEQLIHLSAFAYYLGLIFQVQDDILDVTGDPEKLGKPLGSDEDNDKSTYPKLLGIKGAKDRKQQYVSEAKKALKNAGAADSRLMALTEYFSQRDH
jgi:geranylgeranyl diphosphate synthase type II